MGNLPGVDDVGEMLDIGEVKDRTGLSASALHFYERRGLIDSTHRAGLRRQYPSDVVERLAVLILCQRAGFTLEEIAEILATGGAPRWKDLVAAKLRAVRSQIEDLRRIEDGLTHALQCPSKNVLRCEHFRAELGKVLPGGGAG